MAFLHESTEKWIYESFCNNCFNYVIGEINKLIDNYDNIDERRPFHREGNSLLEMYI